jgi:hypothetical protein
LWSNWWNEDWQGKPKYSEKTCPSTILSTTNPTWPDPCANPSRRGGKPATNRLSYGAAESVPLLMQFTWYHHSRVTFDSPFPQLFGKLALRQSSESWRAVSVWLASDRAKEVAKFCFDSSFQITFGYSFRPLKARNRHVATSNIVLGVWKRCNEGLCSGLFLHVFRL